MTLDFVQENFVIGQKSPDLSPQFIFYRRGFNLGGSSGGGWTDIILHGNTALTLANAKANGINYVKIFGACEQTGTPTPTVPVDIVCNNGAIKYSLNMANVNAQTVSVGYYISNSGAVLESPANWIYQGYIPVEPSTTYTLTMSTPVYYVTISEYKTADDGGFIRRNAGSTGGNTSLTITTRSNTKFIRFGANLDGSTNVTLDGVLAINWMLNEGNSLPYAPYSEDGIYTDGTIETVEVDTTGDTATAEMLLKVGNYQDVQNVTNGNITRNVGIKVLDGTEDWISNTVSSGRLVYYILKTSIGSNSTVLPAGSSNLFCTHYAVSTAQAQSQYDTIWSGGTAINFTSGDKNPTVTDWKQFLKDKYNEGNPVIVLYPLATPTTESVEHQHLSIQAGTNAVEITQASIDNLELEVSYKAKAEGE